MFAFEIWGRFASFKDPFTISQNISLPIPPKTAIAGMMASILGVENYFDDIAFSDFNYSVVTLNPIRKKSFSQNYINDYTSKVQTHLNSLKKSDYSKIKTGLRDTKSPQKPINRELLLDVKYLVFIKNFKYQDKITTYLKNRISKFPLYLGNSEFAGNFKFVEINTHRIIDLPSTEVNSFILESDTKYIEFKGDIRYSNISFATTLNSKRTPISISNIIVGSKAISVKNMSIYSIQCQDKIYHRRFL